jgi:hypothetical protein
MAATQTSARPGRGIHRPAFLLLAILLIGGCAIYAGDGFDALFGPAEPRERIQAADSVAGDYYLQQVQPILEQRCVVCHGCYDSPCQLNLAAPEGIDRGASQDKLYNPTRLIPAAPTRLIEDGSNTAHWRNMDFFPVLNEHQQSARANLEASTMHQMLTLKRENPLPQQALLDDSFELGLDREQQCPKPDQIDEFAEEHPLWGMPYALPGLDQAEFNTLEKWLEDGAQMALPPVLADVTQAELDSWEQFLNGDALVQQLMSRYLYEHWFLAHLYFKELGDGEFFRLVRSSTPPGEPIKYLPTRKPYDDPGVARVYYRLWRDHSTILDKTHMPYALDATRMDWLSKLFLEAGVELDELPSYAPEVAANPFIAYQAIPAESRWQFLLAEAEFTLMNFIKGPVCRGQVALNVIRDRFWVFFTDTQLDIEGYDGDAFLAEQASNLRIPVQTGSSVGFTTWSEYSKAQDKYQVARSAQLHKQFPNGENLNLDLVWDGDGYNHNAALTIFRHFDSASVVKGLVGEPPLTAWVINYPILERIHYLLVAGFDVFGTAGHQLTTRLYMDFLRMEGESNFLALLPPETRLSERDIWYAGASDKQKAYIYGSRSGFSQPTGIAYKTDNPKLELFTMLQQKLAPVLSPHYQLDQSAVPAFHRQALQAIEAIQGLPISLLPEVTFLNVVSGETQHYYTLLHNRAHSNITSLFGESSALLPDQDSVTVVKDFIGSYPSAYWRVEEQDLPALVEQIGRLSDATAYQALMDRFGVRRTAADFWQHSDKVMAAHHAAAPIDNGLLDYNRLENR